MIPQTLATLAEWSGARLIAGDPQSVVGSVGSDSRSLAPGSLLVALRGEHFDAHDFVGEAGAAAVLVSRAVAAAARGAVPAAVGRGGGGPNGE